MAMSSRASSSGNTARAGGASASKRPNDVIALIEDDDDIRDALESLLTHAGYQIQAYPSADLALAAMESGAVPDVILLDLMMPVMNGAQFRRAQRGDADLAGIPVVVMTAAGTRAKDALVELSPMRLLDKPIALDDLLGAVEDASNVDKRA